MTIFRENEGVSEFPILLSLAVSLAYKKLYSSVTEQMQQWAENVIFY